MKKMIVVMIFVAAIAAVLFFGLRAGEEGVAVASATVTPESVTTTATATPEPVALATPVPVPEVNSSAADYLVSVAAGENPETAEVAVATQTSTPVVTPVATQWYEELIEADASKLFATAVATAERGGKTAVFCWALTYEELAEMPADSWAELTQFVTNWDEFKLPQNSQGILALLREMDPLAVYKVAAGSKAPVSSVSEEGFLAIWRDAVSVDTVAVKSASHLEERPLVVALREPDGAGRRYFLVVDGSPAKGYRVEKPVAPAPAPLLIAPGGSNEENPPMGGTGHSNVVITTPPSGGTGHSNVTVTAPSGGTGHSNVTVTTPSGGGTGHSDVAAPAGSTAGGDWIVATGSGRAKAE